MDLKIKIYTNGNLSRSDLECVRVFISFLKLGCVNLSKRCGFEYALYIKAKTKLIDHRYFEEIYRKLHDVEDLDSVEVFIRVKGGVSVRILATQQPKFIKVSNFELLRYRHVDTDSSDLVIYFDYSRLISKVSINDECIPRFGFNTDKSILVLSNNFGYWGTSCLFDTNGNFIQSNVIDFIRSMVSKFEYKRLFFIGGSQGATASLAYASHFPETDSIFAACPVSISKKNMLMHVKGVRDLDVETAIKSIEMTLKECKVFLYTTTSDIHYSYHNKLRELGSENVNYNICRDSSIGHGDCLRFYIKDIYREISSC